MSTGRLNRAFSNIKELDGVEGLNDMITFLRNNRNNANGIDGAIFEGSVARKIKTGQVNSSGDIIKVSNDGIDKLEDKIRNSPMKFDDLLLPLITEFREKFDIPDND